MVQAWAKRGWGVRWHVGLGGDVANVRAAELERVACLRRCVGIAHITDCCTHRLEGGESGTASGSALSRKLWCESSIPRESAVRRDEAEAHKQIFTTGKAEDALLQPGVGRL